jgi:sporulation protein YlmC with PRC-barrel domain
MQNWTQIRHSRKILKATDVLEKEVIGAKGWKIGKIKDIIFNESQWSVNAIDIELEGNIAEEFNISKHFRKTRVPLDVRHIQAISGDSVVLKSSKDELFNIVAASPEKSVATDNTT